MPSTLDIVLNFKIPRMTKDMAPELRRAIESLKRALSDVQTNFEAVVSDLTSIEGDITTIQSGSGQAWDIVKTAAGNDYNIGTSGGNFVVVTSGTGPTDVTLPNPATNNKSAIAVASMSGTVNVVRYGSEEIDGTASSYVLSVNERVYLVCDGTDWFILAT